MGDPGEAVDKPLVYEAGWGKKLTYVIASSKDEVQDVTWRYSKDHVATRGRRNIVRPKWLVKTILQMTSKIQDEYSTAEKDRLAKRRLNDCLEMLTPRKVGDGDKVSRKTGSLAWKIARGEMGSVSTDEGFVFRPMKKDIDNGFYGMEFYIARDSYLLENGDEIEGWRKGVFQLENVNKKVEPDWHKVYLARCEGNDEKGSITWKFQLPEGYVAGKVELLVNSTVFESGRVIWQLCGENACLMPQSATNLETEQLIGSKELKLSANLSGGNWQHTQLFRCDRDDKDHPNMKIRIYLKKV